MTKFNSAKLARAFLASLLVLPIANCGLKGDLYLPEPGTETTNRQTTRPESDRKGSVTPGSDSEDPRPDAEGSSINPVERDEDADSPKTLPTEAQGNTAVQP